MALYVSDGDDEFMKCAAIFRGLISHTATQWAAFIFHACGSVTPGSPLMWQAEAQPKMRQRGKTQKVKQSTMWCGRGGGFLVVQVSRGDEGAQKRLA